VTTGVYRLGGLNVGVNPMLQEEGQFLQLVNVDSDPVGVKTKRPGIVQYLGSVDQEIVRGLFNWTRNNGTQFWNYRYSGSVLYYSTQGTGAWTACGAGTFDGGTIMGHAVLEDVMIVGDGVNPTKHTSDGTSFGTTASAPIASYFEEYQNRIWAGGTASSLFYSTTGTASNWTADSSSISIPGAGKINQVFKLADRLTITKNSGAIFRYDGNNLVDTATKLGPSSSYSLGQVEDYRFWLNRLGIFGYGGEAPQIVSNPIQSYIYNNKGTSISGEDFDTSPAGVYRYNYYVSVGDIENEFSADIVDNAIIVYNYQLNELSAYSFVASRQPRAFLTYKDAGGSDRFVFGDGSGLCWTFGGTALYDIETPDDVVIPITAKLEYVWHGKTLLEKKFNYIRLLFNPGMEGQIQIAVTDTFSEPARNYVTLGQAIDGIVEFHFPSSSRGRFLFVKIIDSSRTSRFVFYGMEIDFDLINHA